MKFKDIKFLSWLAMALMLVTTSCRDDTFSEFFDDNSDEYTVNIDVALEGMDTRTRADEETPHIGGASQIDMLIYAVYYDAAPDKDDPNHIPQWEAAPEYAKIYEAGNEPFGGEVKPGFGQTIIDVSETLQNQKNGRQPITITLKKGFEYKIVFWAQNSKTDAFVTSDLKKVQMKYKVANVSDSGENEYDMFSINNDEARDAFCRSINISGNEWHRNITVFLRRPLAQINVGTRGFDYETITRNSDAGDKYLYSKIRINRATRYLNVVTDKVYTTTVEDDETESSTEAYYTIDYEYSRIPAYWRWGKDKTGKDSLPDYPSYTIFDADHKTGAMETFFQLHPESADDEPKFRKLYDKEEFLRVRLFDHTEEDKVDNGYIQYESMGNAMDTDEDVQNRSEVFKYLSMCYVLTDSSDDYQDVLTNVKVWLAKDENGKDEIEIANLTNVPVQRNHRTNIVGSLLTAKAKMEIVVDQNFAGRKIEESDVQSGEITEGFYYNAEEDEFQISSLNGLLFFQQLVNGNLTVRQQAKDGSNGVKVGDPYPYLSDNGRITYHLKYKSHTRGELGDTKANLIVYGSKYDQFKDNELSVTVRDNETWTINVQQNGSQKDKNLWPEYNNFPFYGAKVKLMADIDLSGIEWIPIGFDCANWDATFAEYKNGSFKNYGNFNYISLLTDNSKNISLGNRRAFCGTFDGNGHTIYNLTTKKFGPNVHESAFQEYDESIKDEPNRGGPYDNVQWFAKGFFGVVGPGAEIKNLRLQNVDIQGNNAVGAVVGQVSSIGFPAQIQNCIVDWGVIDAVPLYRGDYVSTNVYKRTMARGAYIGGIVGQFCAKDDINNNKTAEVTGCEVRNLTIQGFRRVGGIIGGIADQGDATMGRLDIQLDIKVEGNKVRNSKLIVNQYRAFDTFFDHMGTGSNTATWQNGFGWGSSGTYSPMADEIVGGYYSKEETINLSSDNNENDSKYDGFQFGYFIKDQANKNTKKKYFENYVNDKTKNSVSNLQYCQLSVAPNADNGKTNRIATLRRSTIKDIPLEYIPMFTTLFTDEVTLENNYYGKSSLRTLVSLNKTNIYWDNLYSDYYLPINFPNGYDIVYDKTSKHSGVTGMYLESVSLDGKNAPGGRSVITPNEVDKENSCVMYVTARDRMQFAKNEKSSSDLATKGQISDNKLYKKATNISNVVLRGTPYAWAGLLIAPNHNMREVNLTNVTIYDVYKTIALQKELEGSEDPSKLQNYTYWKEYTNDNGTMKPGDKNTSVTLNATNCNFRGYTVPGKGWEKISYAKTTFEQGAETHYSQNNFHDDSYLTGNMGKDNYNIDDNQYKKLVVAAPTDFSGCFFKAPYVIDLSTARDSENNYTVNFNNCKATSAYKSVEVNPYSDEYYINIWVDTTKGETVVDYYGGDSQLTRSVRSK